MLTPLARAVRLRRMIAGVVRYQLDCKPEPRGPCECREPEVLPRESTKALTGATPNENKVGVGATIQGGALKPGEVLSVSVSLALAEFQDHSRFKIM